ncbi:hypothetical protein EJB05_30139, partial [Eragrostis curvula]
RGPCATHGTGRRGHSTPRGHEGAGSTRRGLYLRASAGPAVELLGSAELWVVQELAGTETAVQVCDRCRLLLCWGCNRCWLLRCRRVDYHRLVVTDWHKVDHALVLVLLHL